MKKIYLFFIIFILVAPFKIFSQNIYFITPTSESVFHFPYGGSYGISYIIEHHSSIHVYNYYAKLTYPDGHQSDWQLGLINGETGTGGWWVTEGGTYQIQGKAWVHDLIFGSDHWVYREPFSFSVIADPPPPPLSISISGPTTIDYGVDATWNAYATGGTAPYHYKWWYKYPEGGLPEGMISSTKTEVIL